MIEVSRFQDPVLDPVEHLRTYLQTTSGLRKTDSLFVTSVRPYKAASKQTLAGWLRQVIAHSGQSGSAGSTRSIATSRAASRGASLEAIVQAGDWANASTFQKHYWRRETPSFQTAVLN